MSYLTQHLTDILPLKIRKKQPISELTLYPPPRPVTRARSFDGPRPGYLSPVKQGGPKGPRDINKPRETAKANATSVTRKSLPDELRTAVPDETQQATPFDEQPKPRPDSTFLIEFGEHPPPPRRVSKQSRKAVPTQDQVDTAAYLNEHLISAQLTTLRNDKDIIKAQIREEMEIIGRVEGSEVRYDTTHVKVKNWYAVNQLERELRMLREQEAKCLYLSQYFAGVVGSARRAEGKRQEMDGRSAE